MFHPHCVKMSRRFIHLSCFDKHAIKVGITVFILVFKLLNFYVRKTDPKVNVIA